MVVAAEGSATVERLGGFSALGVMLSPLDGAGLRTDAAVARISAAIGLGVIADGDQLPNENDLATQLGISTMTLREALAVLRQQGLVETKRGRCGGSFVRATPEVINVRALTRLQELTVEELRDLGDEHFALTGATAVLVARRAVAADITKLRVLVTRLAASADPAASRRADSRFQIELAACSQSSRLTRATVRLQAELSPMLWLPQVGMVPATEATHHGRLIDAIETEDETRVRTLAQDHSAATIRRLITLRMKQA